MKALTIKQPFAHAIAIGAKLVEYRSWKTDYRGPLAIHAGCAIPRITDWDEVRAHYNIDLPDDQEFVLGAIVATAELINVTGDADTGYEWHLSSVMPLSKPVNCLGKLRLWETDVL
ncbi:MAG: ASCH domain-containing protein [Hyphomicrobiaceae bacterium]|nr:MAG: ASCH domain-containing protein [Hyphomicrobiaceae bacterium]